MLAARGVFCVGLAAQSAPPRKTRRSPRKHQAQAAGASAQFQGAVRISLDDAIQMALQHNHSLLAARTTIQQSEAQEITANLRPNPVLHRRRAIHAHFPSRTNSAPTISITSRSLIWAFSYLFERGKKRQHRLQAAQDATAHDALSSRRQRANLTFNVAHNFFTLHSPNPLSTSRMQDMKSFQNTVDISQARYNAGDISEDDSLKIKLQLLQFQTDVSRRNSRSASRFRTCGNFSGTDRFRQILTSPAISITSPLTASWKICRRKPCRPGRTFAPRSRASPPPTASTNWPKRTARRTSPAHSITPRQRCQYRLFLRQLPDFRFSIAIRAKSRARTTPSIRRRNWSLPQAIKS